MTCGECPFYKRTKPEDNESFQEFCYKFYKFIVDREPCKLCKEEQVEE
jgi:hypothetical protein